MSSTEKSESLSTGVSRLVRSLSKNPTKVLDGSPTPSGTPSTISVTPNATVTTNVHRIPKQKLTAFERFTQLGRKKDKKPNFPPAAWFDGEAELSVTAVAEGIPLSPTPAIESGVGDAGGGVTEQDNSSKDRSDEAERPEPTSLARKIQDLISALPALSAYSSSSSSLLSNKPTTSSTSTDTPADIPDGSPPMPPPPAPIADSKLISLLSSATIMNGSLSKGKQSVWSILDRLRSPNSKTSTEGQNAQGEHLEEDDDDDSSVMMYAPLQPDASSEVEIARSEICSVDEEGDVISERPGDDLNKLEVSQNEKGEARREQSNGEGKGKGKGKAKETEKVKEVRVWVPSTEKISLQATWWGYRIYLPPPVLDILNNKQLEAAKRAAMITTALKWLLDRIPVKLFPPQFRPILMMLKRLVPYLGYIGVFIAWSWSAIKAFDKGNGVILTATWLLPVALIPGTWEEDLLQPPLLPPKDANNAPKEGNELVKGNDKPAKGDDKGPVKDYKKLGKDNKKSVQ